MSSATAGHWAWGIQAQGICLTYGFSRPLMVSYPVGDTVKYMKGGHPHVMTLMHKSFTISCHDGMFLLATCLAMSCLWTRIEIAWQERGESIRYVIYGCYITVLASFY